MSPRLQKLEAQALLLPPEERETLVESLLQSLRQDALPEIDPDWIAEADRRYHELRGGGVEGVPAERVFREIRQELGWHG